MLGLVLGWVGVGVRVSLGLGLGGLGPVFPPKWVRFPPKLVFCMYSPFLIESSMYLICTVSVVLMHSDVLYRCVFSRCVVMYRHVSHLHAWCLHGLSGLSIQYMRLYRRFSILNDTSRYMTSLSPLPRGCFACVSIQEATELPMGVNYHRRLDT